MKEIYSYLPEGLPHLINGCVRGDRHAQTQLYNLYQRKMLGVCVWYAKNKEEAEEILQDGFIRVFKYIHTFKGEGPLAGWIKKIMINTALLKYRSKGSNVMHVAIEYDAMANDIADTATLIATYDEKELLKLVQSLPPVYRMVFNLYVLEGFKHREIAALLGISENTSRSNLADARAILQKKVNQLQKTAS